MPARGQRGCCSAGWRRFRACTRAARSRAAVAGRARRKRPREPAHRAQRPACGARPRGCAPPGVARDGRTRRRRLVGRLARVCRAVAAGRLEEALSLCRGEVLEGLDAEWVLDLRSRHAAERADAAVALIRARGGGRRGRGARLGAPSRGVPSDRETAQRELMFAFGQAGIARRAALVRRLRPAAARSWASPPRRRRRADVAASAPRLDMAPDLPAAPRRFEIAAGGACPGREAAIARLREALALARGGERCVALVVGEAVSARRACSPSSRTGPTAVWTRTGSRPSPSAPAQRT